MKKFFSILTAFMFMCFVMNAQTVENSRVLENTYVTVYGGAITTTHTGGNAFFWDGAKNIVKGVRPLAGIEVGKYVTPVVGFGLEGLAMFGTTGSNTFVDQSNLVANLKLNLSNWFGGYPGEPRRVDVVFVPGIGWGHDYGNVYNDRDYLTYNLGAELDVNLGREKAFQIVVKPVVMWNNYGTPAGNPLTPTLPHMEARLQAGLSYKFGSRRTNSHNFVNCPYSVTADDYAAAKALIAELENNPVVKEVVVEKVVHDTVNVEPCYVEEIPIMVVFDKNSAKLYDDELIQLNMYLSGLDKNANIVVTGSADTLTGTKEFNNKLANKRAEAVKEYLNKKGFNNVTTKVVLDLSENRSGSRVVIVK